MRERIELGLVAPSSGQQTTSMPFGDGRNFSAFTPKYATTRTRYSNGYHEK